jgi:toxin secretion/phage lysis holin
LKRIKELFIVIGTALSAWLGILYVPAMILFVCNIIDYVTGICAAGYRKENVSSYRSFRGIAKKICMWLLIAVGAMLDILLEYAAKNVGISLGGEYIAGSLAAVWLIANEVISILENIRDIGTPLPPFLMTIAGNIKGKAEDKIK